MPVPNDLMPFVFEDHPVRGIACDGEPWFAAADVCKVIGIANTPMAIEKLDNDEKMTVSLTGSHSGQRGGAQSMIIINESGLYALILRSRKATKPGTIQHRFRKWITAEVIPAIRKTGGYGNPEMAAGTADQDRLMRELVKLQGKLIRASEEVQEYRINRQKNDLIRNLISGTGMSDEDIAAATGEHPAYIEYLRWHYRRTHEKTA
jgi:prophage antirepressor-like protein